jgi:hypothetical protein
MHTKGITVPDGDTWLLIAAHRPAALVGASQKDDEPRNAPRSAGWQTPLKRKRATGERSAA